MIRDLRRVSKSAIAALLCWNLTASPLLEAMQPGSTPGSTVSAAPVFGRQALTGAVLQIRTSFQPDITAQFWRLAGRLSLSLRAGISLEQARRLLAWLPELSGPL